MAELTGTTSVPGMGKVPKKTVAIGVAVVGGLVVIYYVRKGSSSSAAAAPAAAATTTDQYPPDGTTGNPSDPYSTDPATGTTYGDEAAGSGTYGSFGLNSYGSNGVIGYDSAGNPVYAPGYAPQSTGSTSGGPPFANNAAWSAWVIQQLEANNPNLDPGTLTDAIGLYLAGQPVDTAQQQLIFDAQAVGGSPPIAGPNNYPPNVQLNGNKGGSSGGSGGGSNPPPPSPGPSAPVPSVVGMTFAEAKATLAGDGFSVGGGAVQKNYPPTTRITTQTPAAGTRIAYGSPYWGTGSSGPGVDIG